MYRCAKQHSEPTSDKRGDKWGTKDTLGERIGMAAEVAHGSCTDLPPSSGRPRFLAAVSAQTADFNEVRSPKNPDILGIMSLNFLSVCLEMALPHE